jgi:hypothetical protein
MVSMKTEKCPKCGDIVFKLAGKASKLCHDTCLKCRRAERDEYLATLASHQMKEQTDAHQHG